MFFLFHSYDVVFAAGADEILKRFLAFKAKVVISAEGFLWPDKTLLVMTQFSTTSLCVFVLKYFMKYPLCNISFWIHASLFSISSPCSFNIICPLLNPLSIKIPLYKKSKINYFSRINIPK